MGATMLLLQTAINIAKATTGRTRIDRPERVFARPKRVVESTPITSHVSTSPDGEIGVRVSATFPHSDEAEGVSFVCLCGAPAIMTKGTKFLRCTCGRSYGYSIERVRQVDFIVGDEHFPSTDTQGGPTLAYQAPYPGAPRIMMSSAGDDHVRTS